MMNDLLVDWRVLDSAHETIKSQPSGTVQNVVDAVDSCTAGNYMKVNVSNYKEEISDFQVKNYLSPPKLKLLII